MISSEDLGQFWDRFKERAIICVSLAFCITSVLVITYADWRKSAEIQALRKAIQQSPSAPPVMDAPPPKDVVRVNLVSFGIQYVVRDYFIVEAEFEHEIPNGTGFCTFDDSTIVQFDENTPRSGRIAKTKMLRMFLHPQKLPLGWQVEKHRLPGIDVDCISNIDTDKIKFPLSVDLTFRERVPE